jgi:hypothetical protein
MLYFTIRDREPYNILDLQLNANLTSTSDIKEITHHSNKLEYIAFDQYPEIINDTLDTVKNGIFYGIAPAYLKEEIKKLENNVMIFFTFTKENDIQIECILIYHSIDIEVNKKMKKSIFIPAIVVNKVI